MTSTSRHPRLRRFAQNAILLGAVTLLCLVVLEIAVRKLMPYYRLESQIGFVLSTNGLGLGPANQTIRQATPKGDYNLAVRFNKYGFRDPKEVQTATEADWFVVGDSYSFGWGVEEHERYSTLLETKLAGSNSSPRVFNIALPDNIIGYQRLVRYAEECGGRVNRVIVGICMENDLKDYSDGKSAWDIDSKPQQPRKFGKETVRGWLRKSALYNAISFALQGSPPVRRFFEKIGISRNVLQLSGRNEWNEAALRSSRDEVVKVVAGRPALILIIPARRLWFGDNIATEKKVHDTFVQLLTEANLRVVDMRGPLEETKDPLAHYFKTDPHWNARGHALAAEQLAAAIAKEQKPPQASTGP